MKLTKTLLAATALIAFAAPMSATAQVGPGDIVGEISGLNGDMVILRNGNYLQAQNGSAIMANDTIYSRSGSGNIVLSECNTNLATGMKVSIGTGNVCSNLADIARIGARDAALSAGQQSVSVSSAGGSAAGGSVAGGATTGGGIVGATAGLPLAAIGAVVAGGALIAIVSDDDDDSVSN